MTGSRSGCERSPYDQPLVHVGVDGDTQEETIPPGRIDPDSRFNSCTCILRKLKPKKGKSRGSAMSEKQVSDIHAETAAEAQTNADASSPECPYTAEELNIDVSSEGARALHRVVRAMHDGHCPRCGYLGPYYEFWHEEYHECPVCQFRVTEVEARAALMAFKPHFGKSLEVFEQWRSGRPV